LLDIDYSCEGCLKEAIERRFLFYPNHESARVSKLPENSRGVTCTICKGNTAKYVVSIVIGSLRKDLLDKRLSSTQ
jgi:hypothetical protein